MFDLMKYSWDDLDDMLHVFKRSINDFQLIKDRCISMGMTIGEFEAAYGIHISHLKQKIVRIRCEIQRRNKLVGVL